MENSFKPKGYPTLIPYLAVQDADKSIDFYKQTFGFELSSDPIKENDKVQHAEMNLGDCCIMFAPEGAHGNPAKSAASTHSVQGITLYIYVADVDKHYQHCKQAGGKVIMPVDNMFWGDRMYQAQCLNGYMWSFATKSS